MIPTIPGRAPYSNDYDERQDAQECGADDGHTDDMEREDRDERDYEKREDQDEEDEDEEKYHGETPEERNA